MEKNATKVLEQNAIDFVPKVSVIIPVYNVEKYLRECLDSVINQTLKEIEIICVDDGSTDNSLRILKEYAQKDNRITVLTQENQGSAKARNEALLYAKGEYIGFIDSDDFISKNYFEILYRNGKNKFADISATSNIILFPKNVNKLSGLENKKEFIKITDKAKIITTTGVSWNKIYKKKFLIENNINFLENNRTSAEDNYFTDLAILFANKIVVNNLSEYYYRVVETSQTQVVKNEKHFKMVDVYKELINVIETTNDAPFDKKYAVDIIKKRARIDFQYHYDTMKEEIKAEWVKFFINFIEPNRKIIVSLTSYPARINKVDKTIETILNQTLKTDRLILWLAKEQFPNKEQDLPNELLELKNKGLIINWCEDIRSYKKLIPTLKNFPDDIIITADDDIYYENDWLEKLVIEYVKNPNMIHCNRAHYVECSYNKLLPYNDWAKAITNAKPSYNNFFTGCKGVLYPPNSLYKDVLDSEKFLKLAPLGDDIWFWAMAVLNNTKINVIKNNNVSLNYVEDTQDTALYLQNVNMNQNDKQLQAVLNAYPKIYKKLDKKSYQFNKKILKNLFSITNQSHHGKVYKVLTILGVKLKVRNRKKEEENYKISINQKLDLIIRELSLLKEKEQDN